MIHASRLFIAACFVIDTAQAQDLRFAMNKVNTQGNGAEVGSVTVTRSDHGLVFTPDLKGLPPGLHGFHLHENASCAPAPKDGKPSPAEAAGGHYDPDKTGQHGLPWGTGHAGDLPALYVDPKGRATQPVLAPRLQLDQVKNLALMIHQGGDNHADHPEPLGGGGGRLVCGVVAADKTS